MRGGRLQQVLNIGIVLETFGIYRGEVVATGGSTAVGSNTRVFTVLSPRGCGWGYSLVYVT